MGDKGFEPLASTALSAENQAVQQSGGANSGAVASDLQEIIETWPRLSVAARSAVLMKVRALFGATDARERGREGRLRSGGRNGGAT
jgi:hypothetical protein